MGRFRLEPGPIDPKKPHKLVENVGESLAEQGKSQLKIIKNVGLSQLKQKVKNVLVGGDFSPKDLMDPAKYFTEGQIDTIDTLLGISDKREKPKFLTPWGATATDYLVLKKEKITFVEDQNHPKDSSISDQAISTSATPFRENVQFIDLSAIVTISQKKNILMTKVEGRDRSRKEYISGGDIMVSISGTICGKRPEQYPEEEVQLLREMLITSKDEDPVINVENPLLERFGVTGLIILDFKLPQSKASRNQQAYQINAVFEEPAGVIQIKQDEEQSKLKKALANVNEWVALDTLAITTL